jgi:hypothetical protein
MSPFHHEIIQGLFWWGIFFAPPLDFLWTCAEMLLIHEFALLLVYSTIRVFSLFCYNCFAPLLYFFKLLSLFSKLLSPPPSMPLHIHLLNARLSSVPTIISSQFFLLFHQQIAVKHSRLITQQSLGDSMKKIPPYTWLLPHKTLAFWNYCMMITNNQCANGYFFRNCLWCNWACSQWEHGSRI